MEHYLQQKQSAELPEVPERSFDGFLKSVHKPFCDVCADYGLNTVEQSHKRHKNYYDGLGFINERENVEQSAERFFE